MFTLGPITHVTLMVDKNEFNLLWMKLNIQIELHIHVNRPKKKRFEDSYEGHHYNCDRVDKCHP
jgi:hypothetical protein